MALVKYDDFKENYKTIIIQSEYTKNRMAFEVTPKK